MRTGGLTPEETREAVPYGMVEAGEITFSEDGETWTSPRPFRPGKFVNDPRNAPFC